MLKKKTKYEKEQGIVCSHIWTVAYLLYNNIPFLRTEMQNEKVIFIFPDNAEVKQTIQKFILNPQVRLQEFIGMFQQVKNLIYNEKGNEHEQRKRTADIHKN